MDAPHTARIARGRGAVQYAARAFPRSSSPSAMPPLPLPALRDPTVEVRPVPRPGPRPLGEEVRDGGPAERVDEAAPHPPGGRGSGPPAPPTGSTRRPTTPSRAFRYAAPSLTR